MLSAVAATDPERTLDELISTPENGYHLNWSMQHMR
jgi:hypothetical protein